MDARGHRHALLGQSRGRSRPELVTAAERVCCQSRYEEHCLAQTEPLDGFRNTSRVGSKSGLVSNDLQNAFLGIIYRSPAKPIATAFHILY